ncbi:MurR/RpiR family transcriptional regulator [Caldalkalibacillus salinus]|uniref:MurR/RpiR family transcriptional regulator n=1 Tax=Caldalkalibacillus salinus TaxID=2803787 RepID=UPI001F3C334D|nr:MurR/RpiR family transcriptional regulator [Caldalkalibacillus salinus]
MSVSQTMKVKGVIHSYYPSLTKSEQKVADLVVDQFNRVIYYSVTDLADHAEVGETTVLRFCRKIGFKGYQEFKLALAKDLPHVQEEVNEQASAHFIQAVSTYAQNAIQETVDKVDKEALERAIHMILSAKSLQLFGVGTSGVTALDAKYRLLRIGQKADAIIDNHIQTMTAATLTEGDVVIGLSVSGSTKDTIDALRIAKENGATVIAITYYARSPITKVADIVLLSGGKESPLEGSSMAAKIAQLFVIDLLCTGLALDYKEHALHMKEITARSVLHKIY